MSGPSQSIIFVVDGPECEAQSLPLAASLARHHAVGREVALIAYLAPQSQGSLAPATLSLYEACGVETRDLPPPGPHWAKPYPRGNRIIAAAQPRDSQRTISIATDMLCQGKITNLVPDDPFEVFVTPEASRSWGTRASDWRMAYRFFNLPHPVETITLLRGRNIRSLPYFSTGFLGFSDLPLPDSHQTLGQAWLAGASRFDWRCNVPGKRPWLDQITLPLVMAHHRMNCLLLPEDYNYDPSNRDDLTGLAQANILHYHSPKTLLALPLAEAALQHTIETAPPAERDALGTFLAQYFRPAQPPGKWVRPLWGLVRS